MKKNTAPLLFFILIGCSSPTATALITEKSGSNISGKAVFTEKAGNVKINISITGGGEGPVAAHIHVIGDCSSDDGKSAGGHWNPTNEDHGKWGKAAFHSGDLGNIVIDRLGTGTLSLIDTYGRWSIGGPLETNILGKAIIIHLSEDDMRTQPTGAAGARIGCGVIRETD